MAASALWGPHRTVALGRGTLESMNRLLAGAAFFVLAGCGLSLAVDEVAPTPSPTVQPFPGPPPTPTTQPPPQGQDAETDPEPTPDSEGGDAQTVDAEDGAVVPPDPTKVVVSYAAGKNSIVYAFDYTTATFTPQTSTGCPSAEETAVMSDGAVYVTSSDNRDLFKWTSGVGCVRIATNLSLPFALGTAEIAGVEELVGYRSGDYLRVNRTTGVVTTIKANALGSLRPSGDVTRIGTVGYLAAQKSTGSGAYACPSNGDCVVTVSLTDGTPVSLLKHFPALEILGIAHSKGTLLLFANDRVFPFDPNTLVLGAALATTPVGAAFSGAGAPAFPTP